LVTELAVKALDIAVLHGAPWLNQDVTNAVRLCPCHERPAGELRPVVSAHRQGIATKARRTVEQSGDVLP
ncbi:MAG: hypothetical protein AN487_22680, partial [Anabaena sp. CRKS33]